MEESDCDFAESAEGALNKNVGEDSGFSSTNMTPDRQNKGVPKTITLKIKLFDINYDFETEGNESIYEMVERMLKEVDHGRKPNLNRMLFKTMSDNHLNLGVPTGALERDAMYKCIFMGNSKTNTTDYIRKFNAPQFCDNWKMNYFDVKFDTNITVGYMQSVQNVSNLRVHYFPEETLYEALYRDGRFEKLAKNEQPVIRSCDCISVNGNDIVILNAKAEKYAERCFTFRKRNHVNPALPENVPKLDTPSHIAVLPSLKKEPETPVKSNGEAPQGVFQPSASSTPVTTLQVRKLQSFEDLQLFVEEDLGLKLQQERSVTKEDQRNRKFKNFLKEHYQDFAHDFSHAFSMSDFEHFVKLKLSVGAVIAVNVSGVPKFWGTCSRIGNKYVLTNHHVYEKVKNFADSKLSSCYVDFNYKGKDQERRAVCFIDNALLFSCKDLDYAIMELDTRYRLPDSFTDLGFHIPPPTHHLQAGENLSLIGYPNGMEQMTNLFCPIKPEKKIEDHLILALHHLKESEFEFHRELVSKACNDPNTAVYDVYNFFWGSSGSPGVLIEEKLFVVLHRRGVLLRHTHVLEEGTLMSSIVEDVIRKLKGSYIHSHLTLDDIFGMGTEENFQPEPMEID